MVSVIFLVGLLLSLTSVVLLTTRRHRLLRGKLQKVPVSRRPPPRQDQPAA